MIPSAPHTGSNTVELHIHESLHVAPSGLMFEDTMDLKEKNTFIFNDPFFMVNDLSTYIAYTIFADQGSHKILVHVYSEIFDTALPLSNCPETRKSDM